MKTSDFVSNDTHNHNSFSHPECVLHSVLCMTPSLTTCCDDIPHCRGCLRPRGQCRGCGGCQHAPGTGEAPLGSEIHHREVRTVIIIAVIIIIITYRSGVLRGQPESPSSWTPILSQPQPKPLLHGFGRKLARDPQFRKVKTVQNIFPCLVFNMIIKIFLAIS